MTYDVYSGKYKVLDSNMIILFDSEADFKIIVKASLTFTFSITLEFRDTESGERNVERVVEGNDLTFKCKNFEALGAGSTAPFEIATVGNKKIYLHFWSYKPTKEVRKVEYTLFIQKEEVATNE